MFKKFQPCQLLSRTLLWTVRLLRYFEIIKKIPRSPISSLVPRLLPCVRRFFGSHHHRTPYWLIISRKKSEIPVQVLEETALIRQSLSLYMLGILVTGNLEIRSKQIFNQTVLKWAINEAVEKKLSGFILQDL